MANRKTNARTRKQPGNPARRASGGPAPQRRAAAPGRPAPTGFRASLERVSGPILIRMHLLPKWIVPVMMALLLTAGLFLSGPWAWLGAVLLTVVGLFLGWLFLLSWPVLSPGAKLSRVLVVVALFGLAVLKAMGRM